MFCISPWLVYAENTMREAKLTDLTFLGEHAHTKTRAILKEEFMQAHCTRCNAFCLWSSSKSRLVNNMPRMLKTQYHLILLLYGNCAPILVIFELLFDYTHLSGSMHWQVIFMKTYPLIKRWFTLNLGYFTCHNKTKSGLHWELLNLNFTRILQVG